MKALVFVDSARSALLVLLNLQNRKCSLLVMRCGPDRPVGAFCIRRTVNLRDQIRANLADSLDLRFLVHLGRPRIDSLLESRLISRGSRVVTSA